MSAGDGAAPRFFATAAAFRAWLEKHHASEASLLVGFHRVASGRGGLTYAEALDEALCFGWIDGLRRGFDEASYTVRFSPRKPGSIWSQVNLRHVARLEREGRMAEAGRRAHAVRDPQKTFQYSFEVRRFSLAPAFAKRLAADAKARAHYGSMPPGYHHQVTHWIMSAKQEATRERRFAILLDCSRRGVRVPPLDFRPKRGATAAVKPAARPARRPAVKAPAKQRTPRPAAKRAAKPRRGT